MNDKFSNFSRESFYWLIFTKFGLDSQAYRPSGKESVTTGPGQRVLKAERISCLHRLVVSVYIS